MWQALEKIEMGGQREVRKLLEDLGINVRLTFSLISKNMMVGYDLDTSGSVQGPMAECCEQR
jgi:hypothetical protein